MVYSLLLLCHKDKHSFDYKNVVLFLFLFYTGSAVSRSELYSKETGSARHKQCEHLLTQEALLQWTDRRVSEKI